MKKKIVNNQKRFYCYGVLKAPEKRHWTITDIEKAGKRMRRFESSKAHKKARWQKAIERFYKRLYKQYN